MGPHQVGGDVMMNAPNGKFFQRGGAGGMKSEAQLRTKKNLQDQQNKGFSFTDESMDQRQIDADIREKYRQQLGEMPSILGDDMLEDGTRMIGDAYNPLLPGNMDNPDFYRNLYKAFKMTRLSQAENLSYKNLGPDGRFHPNYESEEFEQFRKQVKKFAQMHGKCGEFCKHL